MATVNKKEFKRVVKELEGDDTTPGRELTFADIGAVFGADFWEMLVIALMDAQDAARAIQGAIGRLRAGEQAE